MINVKKIGDKTENLLLKEISKFGYWCHLFAYNISGQPCDVVALKENKSFLIDVKHCKGDCFVTSRIEPNQHACFKYASSLNINCGFALYNQVDNTFYWLDYRLVEKCPNTKHFKLTSLKKISQVL